MDRVRIKSANGKSRWVKPDQFNVPATEDDRYHPDPVVAAKAWDAWSNENPLKGGEKPNGQT